MKYPRYERFKPSGVSWLGDIPEHWVPRKVAHGFHTIGSGTTPRSDSSDYYDGNISWVTTSELRETVIRETKQSLTAMALTDYSTLKTYPVGTLLLAMYGATIGRIGILGIPATVNQACCAFGWPKRFSPKFVFYWLWMRRPVLISLSSGGGQPNLSQADLRNIWIPAPPLPEQELIAAFLDCKTAEIDALAIKKRALIEKLKEKRSALISRTITRGLPPELARTAGLEWQAKLRPSGVDWLGNFPAHWQIQKFSRVVSIAEGQVDPETEPYVSMVLIAPNHIESGTGRFLYEETAADQAAESGKYFCLAGDVVYSKIRPALAKVTIASRDCICSADMYPLRIGRLLTNRYLFWTLLSQQFTAWSVLEADRVAMPKINRETLNELRVPVPPIPEQLAIADFLDRETAKIDLLVAKVEQVIERLQEYRTALITAAVTGKIDVRQEQSGLGGQSGHGGRGDEADSGLARMGVYA